MNDLRITPIQTDIIWENKEVNLNKQQITLQKLKGTTDIVIFPEMFTTGFSMNSRNLAETENGETISRLKYWANTYEFALAGSFICNQNDKFYNRGFFIAPGNQITFYDKRHLFRMAGEDRHFTAGDKRMIVRYKDWNICLQVCYDLRFPVWSRNVDNEYDLLIYVANWPEARKKVWKTLLQARAMENMAYVCGVNRVGIDGKGFVYRGDSMIFSPKGKKLADAGKREEVTRTCTLTRADLEELRGKFPAWKDADMFEIK